MKRFVKLFLAGAALAGLLSGCATYDYGYPPAYYGYGYGYDYGYRPYYDYGPYYGPGYYVGPPLVGFDFRYSDRDYRDHRRWDGDRGRDWDGDHRRSRAEGAGRPAPMVQRNAGADSGRGQRIAPAPVAQRGTTAQRAQTGNRSRPSAQTRDRSRPSEQTGNRSQRLQMHAEQRG